MLGQRRRVTVAGASVVAPTKPTLTAPGAGDVYPGVAVTVSATVTAGQVPDRIDFVLDPGGSEIVVATDAASPYSQSWTPAQAVGAHTLVARFVYGSGSVDSDPINLTIYNPTADADLAAWFDPNDTANMTKDGPTGQVSSWAQKAGALVWTVTQTPGTTCPIWSATGSPGGGPILSYSAANSTYLKMTTGAGNQPKTVLLAIKAAAFAGETWCDAGSGINQRRIFISATNVSIYAGAQLDGPAPRANVWNAVAGVFSGNSSLSARWNATDGYNETAGAAGTAAANGITLGAYPNPGGYCTGSMGHVVVINRAMSTADIQRLFAWMAVAP